MTTRWIRPLRILGIWLLVNAPIAGVLVWRAEGASRWHRRHRIARAARRLLHRVHPLPRAASRRAMNESRDTLLLTLALTALTASGCGAKHSATKPSASNPSKSTCTLTFIAEAGTESACVDAAGNCHAYRMVRAKRQLTPKELHRATADRVCRDLLAQYPMVVLPPPPQH